MVCVINSITGHIVWKLDMVQNQYWMNTGKINFSEKIDRKMYYYVIFGKEFTVQYCFGKAIGFCVSEYFDEISRVQLAVEV